MLCTRLESYGLEHFIMREYAKPVVKRPELVVFHNFLTSGFLYGIITNLISTSRCLGRVMDSEEKF